MIKAWVCLTGFCMLLVSMGCGGGGGSSGPLQLRWAEAWPINTDPALAEDFASSIYALNVYDTLYFPDANGDPKPHLATQAPTVSDDYLTYTFTLRNDVVFHSGDKLEADDVVFSLERLLALKSGLAALLDRVESVEALNATTVRIKLVEPYGPFLVMLYKLYIMNEDEVMANLDPTSSEFGEKKDYGKKWLASNAAGSGPYMIKEYKKDEYILLERFKTWWGGWQDKAPDLFQIISNLGEQGKLENKQLDVSSIWLSHDAFEKLALESHLEIAGIPEASNFNIMLNTQRPPTDDVHFRKALAYLTDYDALLAYLPGSSKPHGPVPTIMRGFETPAYEYTKNLQKAQDELDLSACKDKLSADECKVHLVWVSEVPSEEDMALAFQSQAAALGITVVVVEKPWATLLEDAKSKENALNGTFIQYGAFYPEGMSMLERYHTSYSGTWMQWEWLEDAVLDQAIDDALATVDENERFTKYAAVQATIMDKCPTIWFADMVARRAYRTGIYFPAAVAAEKGDPVNPVQGYVGYAHDFKILSK